MDLITRDRLAEIRRQNDNFRTSFCSGKILLTPGVAALPAMEIAAAMQKVADFTDWTPDIDVTEEHDYLTFTLNNREFIFIIQYWDRELQGRSPDPADPSVTKRVAVLMLTHEW